MRRHSAVPKASTEARGSAAVGPFLSVAPLTAPGGVSDSQHQRQSFRFDTEDTGPAYTQVQIQHRDSQAPFWNELTVEFFASQVSGPYGVCLCLRPAGCGVVTVSATE